MPPPSHHPTARFGTSLRFRSKRIFFGCWSVNTVLQDIETIGLKFQGQILRSELLWHWGRLQCQFQSKIFMSSESMMLLEIQTLFVKLSLDFRNRAALRISLKKTIWRFWCWLWLGHNESETLQNRKRQERFARFPHLLTKPSKIRRLSTSENLLIHYRDSGKFLHTICFLCKYISKRKSIY